jgi:hypothetical protein
MFPGSSCDILYTFCIATSTLVHSFQYCPELLVPWFMARAHRRDLALLSGDLLACEDFYHVCLINTEHGDHGGFHALRTPSAPAPGACADLRPPSSASGDRSTQQRSCRHPRCRQRLRCRSVFRLTSRAASVGPANCLQQPELVRRTGCSNDLVLLHSWPRPLTLGL